MSFFSNISIDVNNMLKGRKLNHILIIAMQNYIYNKYDYTISEDEIKQILE